MFSGQGQVSQVSAKPFTDKWGKNITLYSFQIQGDQSWYRTGTNLPPCNQGDNISFIFEQQGNNKKVDPNSIQGGGQPMQPQVQQPQQAPMQQQQPNSNFAPPGGSGSQGQKAPAATRDTYWKDKETYDKSVTQPRIAYAAAQKTAVSIVDMALKADVLSLGSGKKADKLELLINYVEEITGRLALKLDSAHEILAELKLSDGSEEPNYAESYANDDMGD